MEDRLLITGGAGFVGSNLAIALREALPQTSIIALDNLKRRGSELAIDRLRAHGIEFMHGDVRCPEDFDACLGCDVLIDCSAEPSVLAGASGSPQGVLQNNLAGTLNCLEAARRWKAGFLFLSTSRVYPIQAINDVPWRETTTRFEWMCDQPLPGVSLRGVSEDFSLAGARSIYGATKLAAELLLQEYAFNYGMPALINRCGLLAGPWQMGKVDQGVITLWIARHVFGRPLKFIGFGGSGKQVRDVLHVADLGDLVLKQLANLGRWNGQIYNVGGGLDRSVSLVELTEKCQALTGEQVAISSVAETNRVDVRWFVTNSARVERDYDWRPRRSLDEVLTDIHEWILAEQQALEPILA